MNFLIAEDEFCLIGRENLCSIGGLAEDYSCPDRVESLASLA